MEEQWKEVEEYEEYYHISNLGRIKSLKRRNRGVDMIMTPCNSEIKKVLFL